MRRLYASWSSRPDCDVGAWCRFHLMVPYHGMGFPGQRIQRITLFHRRTRPEHSPLMQIRSRVGVDSPRALSWSHTDRTPAGKLAANSSAWTSRQPVTRMPQITTRPIRRCNSSFFGKGMATSHDSRAIWGNDPEEDCPQSPRFAESSSSVDRRRHRRQRTGPFRTIDLGTFHELVHRRGGRERARGPTPFRPPCQTTRRFKTW
jgi:hypothetical protein